MRKITLILTIEQSRMLLKALSTTLKGHAITMSVETADRIIGTDKPITKSKTKY